MGSANFQILPEAVQVRVGVRCKLEIQRHLLEKRKASTYQLAEVLESKFLKLYLKKEVFTTSNVPAEKKSIKHHENPW